MLGVRLLRHALAVPLLLLLEEAAQELIERRRREFWIGLLLVVAGRGLLVAALLLQALTILHRHRDVDDGGHDFLHQRAEARQRGHRRALRRGGAVERRRRYGGLGGDERRHQERKRDAPGQRRETCTVPRKRRHWKSHDETLCSEEAFLR